MFKSWRRILTVKALALSAVLVAALVATALARRRQAGAGQVSVMVPPPDGIPA